MQAIENHGRTGIENQKQNDRAERGGNQQAEAEHGEAEGAEGHGSPMSGPALPERPEEGGFFIRY